MIFENVNDAGIVYRYYATFPRLRDGFNSRYPLQHHQDVYAIIKNMEKPPVQEIKQPEQREDEFNPEEVDELIATRHDNAVALFGIEKMLTGENCPAVNSPEYKARVDRAKEEYGKLDIKHQALERERMFLWAVERYLIRKVEAQKQEAALRRELKNQKLDSSAEGLGSYLFEWQTGKKSKGWVRAEQREGYFLLFFENNADFSHFSRGGVEEADVEKAKSTGGRYHRAIALPRINSIKAILVNGPADAGGMVLHERQHFFNDAAFDDFILTEVDETSVPKNLAALRQEQEKSPFDAVEGLRAIKDELLAYIRDGSGADRATGFIGNKLLYGHLLKKFSEEAREDIKRLMEQIRTELEDLFRGFGGYGIGRAILVYLLIDVPLVRMPAMLNRMKKFYDRRVSRLTSFMPDDEPTREQRRRIPALEKLYLDIVGEAYSGIHYIYDEGKSDVFDALADSLKKMRKRYDRLQEQAESPRSDGP